MDLPIKNESDHKIELLLEPEGDSSEMMPGDRCLIRLAHVSDPVSLDLHIEYQGQAISVSDATGARRPNPPSLSRALRRPEPKLGAELLASTHDHPRIDPNQIKRQAARQRH